MPNTFVVFPFAAQHNIQTVFLADAKRFPKPDQLFFHSAPAAFIALAFASQNSELVLLWNCAATKLHSWVRWADILPCEVTSSTRLKSLVGCNGYVVGGRRTWTQMNALVKRAFSHVQPKIPKSALQLFIAETPYPVRISASGLNGSYPTS